MAEEILHEQLKTIKNLCDVAALVIASNCKHLLPTVLELMLVEVQEVVDEHCVVRGEE